jgi:hypothetical protein
LGKEIVKVLFKAHDGQRVTEKAVEACAPKMARRGVGLVDLLYDALRLSSE